MKTANLLLIGQSAKRNFFILLFIFTFLFLTITKAEAQNYRHWLGNTTDWNNTVNWSTTAGGSSGASVPGVNDFVYFNSAQDGNCNINATVSVYAFYMLSGYSGTITNTNYAFTVSSNEYFKQSSGTFNGGSSNITVGLRLVIEGGIFNCGSGTLDINGTNGTSFHLTGGTFTATSGSMYIPNDWKHETSGTFIHNNGTVVFDGTSSSILYMVGNTETFYNLRVDKTSSGGINLYSTSDKATVTGNLILNQGFFGSWNSNSVSIEVLGNVTVANTFNYAAQYLTFNFTGTANQSFDLTGATNKIDGNITINKASGQVNLLSALVLDGAGVMNFTSGTLNLNGYDVTITYAQLSTCTGTFTLVGTGSLTNYGWTQTSGSAAFNINDASTFVIGSGHFAMSNGTFNAGSATLDFNGNFQFTGGTFTNTSGNMYLSRDWNHITSGTFNHNNGTVTFDGTSANSPAKIQIISNSETFYNVTINRASGFQSIYTLNDNIIILGNLNLTSGYLATWNGSSTATVEVRGNVTVASTFGTFDPILNLNLTGAAQSITMTGAEAKILGNINVSSTTNLNMMSNVTVNTSKTFTVATGGALNMGTNVISGTGSFVTASGSKLRLGSTLGITTSGATGNIQTSTRTFNTGTYFYYNGSTGAQVTGNALPSTIYSLTTSNTDGVTLQSNASISSFLSVSGGFLDMGTYTLNRSAQGGSLILNSGGVLKIKGSNTLPTNYATHDFEVGTTVDYCGSSAQAIASTTYKNLTINNSAGYSTSGNITVDGILTLTSGRISLGAYILSMGSSATLSGGSTSSFVFTGGAGVFKWLNCATSSTKVFPIGHTNSAAGYTPLTLTFNAGHTSDDFSALVFNSIRSNGTSSGGTEYTSSVVKTTWDISETNSGGSNVSLQFQWNGTDEGSGFVRSSCGVAHYTASTWGSIGSYGGASGSNPYTFSQNNYTGTFSPFGINGGTGTLPIELLSFRTEKVGNSALITWATSMELNNDYFTIEKSMDGKNFKSIGKIYGAGNSQQILNYAFLDSTLMPGLNYYRLKQMDYDGKYSYSTINVIDQKNQQQPKTYIVCYPIPASDHLNIELIGNNEKETTLEIINLSGRTVFQKNIPLKNGNNAFDISLDNLPNGIFILNFQGMDHYKNTRFVVNK